VHRSEYDQRIVQSLIKLAKELGYKVIAEGVETVEALSLIRSWGCDEAQGYFFAKPMTPLSLKQYRNQYVQRKM
jgi:EAL domain-containing protein (putative c-di-GMP-specific phosphodiesterase class I)